MRLLRYRPRSVAEARDRLRSLGFADYEIDKAISTAEAADLLNDEVFAKLWVEDRLLHHPLSRRAIVRELEEKKLDREIIAAAIDALYPAEEEKRIALDLARVRLARYTGIERNKRIQRTIAFLVRRGFNPSLAGQVVRLSEKTQEEDMAADTDRLSR